MRRLLIFAMVLVALGAAAVTAGNLGIPPVVITKEGEQKLILLFGEVRTATTPGWTLMIPFLEVVKTYEARWLHNSTDALPIQTKDGEQLVIDNYTVWRIQDARTFLENFPAGMNAAEQRIDRVVRDEVREVIGRHTLAEVLKDQRVPIMDSISEATLEKLSGYGIDVADVRINRTELPKTTEESVFARMTTERERLAKKNRAEGEERARRIRAEAEREALVIVAKAKRDSEITRGEGDAQAARIYSDGYESDAEFYAFVRSLDAYRKTLDERTTLVLPPDNEFFRYLDEKAANE